MPNKLRWANISTATFLCAHSLLPRWWHIFVFEFIPIIEYDPEHWEEYHERQETWEINTNKFKIILRKKKKNIMQALERFNGSVYELRCQSIINKWWRCVVGSWFKCSMRRCVCVRANEKQRNILYICAYINAQKEPWKGACAIELRYVGFCHVSFCYLIILVSLISLTMKNYSKINICEMNEAPTTTTAPMCIYIKALNVDFYCSFVALNFMTLRRKDGWHGWYRNQLSVSLSWFPFFNSLLFVFVTVAAAFALESSDFNVWFTW